MVPCPHLDGLHPVDEAVQPGEHQGWGEVPGGHRPPVPLVLAQVGPAHGVGLPEELQHLQARPHLGEGLGELSLQDLLWAQEGPGLGGDRGGVGG